MKYINQRVISVFEFVTGPNIDIKPRTHTQTRRWRTRCQLESVIVGQTGQGRGLEHVRKGYIEGSPIQRAIQGDIK